jgi:Lon-like ATP-dependent protease
VDKIGRGHQGDPASALLEMLDPEQNDAFMDHYMDVPIDLSRVLFVCTANVLDTIPGPLLDRMEVIQLSGYVGDEKMAIAERYLAPAAREAAGLANVDVRLTSDAIDTLIRSYCRESGVRNLKKHIEKIYRKAALKIVREHVDEPDKIVECEKVQDSDASAPKGVSADDEHASQDAHKTEEKTTAEPPKPVEVPKDVHLEITGANLHEYVGPPVFTTDRLYQKTPPGVVMGLAWTSMGGSALYVESILSASLDSSEAKPGLSKTGQMGDVMKESSTIAYTYIKSLMVRRFPENKFFEKACIHLHVPEGATPKDGPSAGITMATSLLSLALNKPLPPTVAMTGELTLTGKVLKIGGLKEKTIAARRSGVDTVIFPAANRPDWEELPDHVKEGVRGVPVEWYEEIPPLVGLVPADAWKSNE